MSNLKFSEQDISNQKLSLVMHPDYYNYDKGEGVWQADEYNNSLDELNQHNELESKVDYVVPEMATKEDALRVHTPGYTNVVFNEHPSEGLNPGWAGGPWNSSSQRAVLRAAGGMIRNNEEALKRGISVQLYDAAHHAYPDHGEGFCVLNDVAMAAVKVVQTGKRVMIIDTDIHQGQGTAVCTQNNPDIYTLSLHEKYNYPTPKEKSSQDIELPNWITTKAYLTQLMRALTRAVAEFGRPDLVEFIAGTDLFEGDKLSATKISIKGIEQINKYIFDFFGAMGVPVATSIPQGYAEDPKHTRILIQNVIRQAMEAKKNYYSHEQTSSFQFSKTSDLYHNKLFTVVPKGYDFSVDLTPKLQNFSDKYVFLWDTWDELNLFNRDKWKVIEVFLPKDAKFHILGKVGTTAYTLPQIPKGWPMQEVFSNPGYVQ